MVDKASGVDFSERNYGTAANGFYGDLLEMDENDGTGESNAECQHMFTCRRMIISSHSRPNAESALEFFVQLT
ncbi:hypothetical protein MHYP_G00350070 [Metynnis hypsauchen]